MEKNTANPDLDDEEFSRVVARVLHLEDSARDHELVREMLRAQGLPCELVCVKTRADFEKELKRMEFDVILSDFAMPGYDGLSALGAAREIKPDTPFIFVSGTIGEERAVESLLNGATDYVLKGNLRRLAPAVFRALREAKVRAERRLAAEALRESQERLVQATRAAQVELWEFDIESRKAYFSSEWKSRLGYADDELPNEFSTWESLTHPDDREMASAALRATADQPEQPCEFESRLRHKDGSYKWLLIRGKLVPNKEGKFTRMLCCSLDITKKKDLEAQSLRAQRLESIGTLAGGIAHDLNNTLAPILMAIDILRLKFASEGAERILATMETSARRGADMVKQILMFSRGVEGERGHLRIDRLIKDLAKLLNQTFPKSIEIRIDLENDLWPVIADATQVHQVIMNLCVNARDAMPSGGSLTCAASNFRIDETFAATHSQTKVGPYTVIRVADTGTGIPPEVRERIFEPFFTTKALDKGTGLGLSTTLGIVKSHGGFLTVQSEPGKGTEFAVYLPAQETGDSDQAELARSAPPSGNGEWILFVDDEASIRNIAQQTLEMFGFQILTASDGAEAAGLCAEHAGKLKVLITDMMMPIMDGHATIRAVRKIAPRIKVIAASGFAGEAQTRDLVSLKVDSFLQKPFTAERLLRAVDEALKQN